MPAISIITATYNRSAALAVAIRSVLAQTFTDWELIVVGDACTDDTAEVVAHFADPRIRYVALTRNFGEQAGPNNVGIAQARAELVAFLNHDDLWLPDHLALGYEYLQATFADLVFSANANIWPTSRYDDHYRGLVVYAGGLSERGLFEPLGARGLVVPCSSWLAKKSMLVALGGFAFAKDIVAVPSQDLLLRAHRAGYKLLNTPTMSVIVIASSTREGSYFDDAGEQRWFLERLHDPTLRSGLLARAVNDTPLSVVERAFLAAQRVIGRLGVHPLAIDFWAMGLGRPGAYVRHLRNVRGLVTLDATTPLGRLRNAEAKRAAPVALGTRIDVSSAAAVLGAGFSFVEPWGVWTEGPRAELVIRMREPMAVRVSLEGHGFVGEGYDGRDIEVLARDRSLLRRVLHRGDDARLDVTVAPEAIREGILVLTLRTHNPISPKEVGVADDTRKLGYALRALQIDAVDGP
jgi:GT2 family glycosyltransferase